MKKIILLISLIVSGYFSNAQFVPQSLGGAPNFMSTVQGAFSAKKGIVIPSFPDTLTANLDPSIKKTNGLLIKVGDIVYIRNQALSRWLVFGSSAALFGVQDNVSDVNREMNMQGNSLFIYNSKNSHQIAEDYDFLAEAIAGGPNYAGLYFTYGSNSPYYSPPILHMTVREGVSRMRLDLSATRATISKDFIKKDIVTSVNGQPANDLGEVTVTFPAQTFPAQTFASLLSKPTTLLGYGIIDGYPLSGNPSGYAIDNAVVHLTGAETIYGQKIFGSPIITTQGFISLGYAEMQNSSTTYLYSQGNADYFTFSNNSGKFQIRTQANTFGIEVDQSGSVGIGTLADIPSSRLTVGSTTQGSRPFPVMTSAQRLSIANPAIALHVYQTDGTEGVYVYKSSGWVFAY